MNSSIQQDVEKWVSVYKNPSSDTQTSISEVLNRFKDFTHDYIEFLRIETGKMPNIFPEDYLAFSIESVLVEYWEPIKRVAQQYTTEKYLFEKFQIEYSADENLMEIGNQELIAYNNNLPLKAPRNMLLYFDKIEKAIRYPFGPVQLIGIPYQDAKRKDWSAIPHEIGHHVYWNLLFNFDGKSVVPYRGEPTIFTVAPDSPNQEDISVETILGLWSEEIFAETIGTLIGKEKFLNSAFTKVLARTEVDDELFRHDNEHPAPYFIPFIRGFTLAEKVNDDMWEQYGGKRFRKIKEITDDSDVPQIADTEDIKIGLKNLVKQIAKLFDKSIKPLEELQREVKYSIQSVSPFIESISILKEKEDEKFDINILCDWVKKEQKIDDDEDLIRALLIPRILEGHKWKCKYCGKVNENDTSKKCAFCGKNRKNT